MQPAEPLASANAAETSWGNALDQLIGQTLVIRLSVVMLDVPALASTKCPALDGPILEAFMIPFDMMVIENIPGGPV